MSQSSTFSNYIARLRGFIRYCATAEEPLASIGELEVPFQQFALELFGLQFAQVAAYRRFCFS